MTESADERRLRRARNKEAARPQREINQRLAGEQRAVVVAITELIRGNGIWSSITSIGAAKGGSHAVRVGVLAKDVAAVRAELEARFDWPIDVVAETRLSILREPRPLFSPD